ncbi:hypothetical protein ElyMa_002416400 [Elysia marginata]|uniref:Uncharacterized protein n=1 Tax=Elysia marginata TaxID=1093978 RepID=A0AAV4GFW5_9GAST|nr:hypothetical protein ElyMa_002416400 [Elysia marginata]
MSYTYIDLMSILRYDSCVAQELDNFERIAIHRTFYSEPLSQKLIEKIEQLKNRIIAEQWQEPLMRYGYDRELMVCYEHESEQWEKLTDNKRWLAARKRDRK